MSIEFSPEDEAWVTAIADRMVKVWGWERSAAETKAREEITAYYRNGEVRATEAELARKRHMYELDTAKSRKKPVWHPPNLDRKGNAFIKNAIAKRQAWWDNLVPPIVAMEIATWEVYRMLLRLPLSKTAEKIEFLKVSRGTYYAMVHMAEKVTENQINPFEMWVQSPLSTAYAYLRSKGVFQ